MERVPRAEEVVALIHQTLVPPPGSDRAGGQSLAGPVVSEIIGRAPSLQAAVQGRLQADERLEWVGRPSLRLLLDRRRGFVLALWLLGIGGLLCVAVGWFFSGPLVGLGASMLALLAGWLLRLVRLRRTCYFRTTKRVLIHKTKLWVLPASLHRLKATRLWEVQMMWPYIVWAQIGGQQTAFSVISPAIEAVAELIRGPLPKP
jgi:hypothetical protein